MNTATIYCSACDKQVHLACTAAPLHEGEANLPDGPELVCLTFGSGCASGRCPISGLPSVVMGVRLARSGMQPEEAWRTIQMHCEGCDRVTEMSALDNIHAVCSICGATNRWFRLNMGDDALLVSVPGAR